MRLRTPSQVYSCVPRRLTIGRSFANITRACQNVQMSSAPEFHEVHISDAIQGIVATVHEGIFRYRLLVILEALRELGASVEQSTWMHAFDAHRDRIGKAASALHQLKPPNTSTIIATFRGID